MDDHDFIHMLASAMKFGSIARLEKNVSKQDQSIRLAQYMTQLTAQYVQRAITATEAQTPSFEDLNTAHPAHAHIIDHISRL